MIGTLRRDHRERALALVVILASCGAIAARRPSMAAVVVIGFFGAAALITPVDPQPGVRMSRAVAVMAAGIAAFVLVSAGAPPVLQQATIMAIGANIAAAVAEEALFRRVAYAWLLRHGAPVAILVGAALFAVVHVPLYGPEVLFIDFGAGVLFGWQRWAAGTWIVPAITHIVANMIQMG